MHGKLKRNGVKRRASIVENVLIILTGAFAFLLARNFHSGGVPQKWATALLGTLITFGFIVYAFRQRLLRWSFWASLTIGFSLHALVIFIFFQYFLNTVARFSILFWLPIMLVEVFVLLIVVKKIEEKLIGQHITMTLD
jgi:hypothetical protein